MLCSRLSKQALLQLPSRPGQDFLSSRRQRSQSALSATHQEQQQVGWQGASDFLIRNERLAARGQRTFDFSLNYLEEGSSGGGMK